MVVEVSRNLGREEAKNNGGRRSGRLSSGDVFCDGFIDISGFDSDTAAGLMQVNI